MSVFILKIIAIITMLMDHIGAIFFPEILIFRFIGRIAFPIYAYLIAQGLLYTKDKMKYFKRIGIIALISEIPFDLAFHNSFFYMKSQNVLFLFFIIIGSIIIYEKLKEKNKDPFYAILLGVILSVLFKVDYSFIGAIIIYLFYFLSKREINYKIKPLHTILICLFMLLYHLISSGMFYVYFGIIISYVLILLHNGKLGIKNKFINILFYSFYPIHLIILYFISSFIR